MILSFIPSLFPSLLNPSSLQLCLSYYLYVSFPLTYSFIHINFLPLFFFHLCRCAWWQPGRLRWMLWRESCFISTTSVRSEHSLSTFPSTHTSAWLICSYIAAKHFLFCFFNFFILLLLFTFCIYFGEFLLYFCLSLRMHLSNKLVTRISIIRAL